MSKRINYLILILSVLFVSCSNDEVAHFESTELDASVIIKQDQLDDILDMIDYVRVNQINTRTSTRSDEPSPGTGHRVYMTWWWCSGSGGNCLSDVIITPEEPNNAIASPNKLLDAFLTTEVGKLLDSYVDSGELNLDIHNNEKNKTSFLVYSNSTNSDKSMVIPLVQK